MTFYIREQEIERTYKVHFETPVIATHPNFPAQGLSFRDAEITLRAYFDKSTKRWKPKRNGDGSAPTLTLVAPEAKRVVNGRVTKFDAFHFNGSLRVTPIPLTNIQKRSWDDTLEKDLRDTVVNAFWREILT